MECDNCGDRGELRKCLASNYTMITGGCYNTKQVLCDKCVEPYLCKKCKKYGCKWLLEYEGPYAIYNKRFVDINETVREQYKNTCPECIFVSLNT